jgi:hypothetical protein
MVTPQEFTKKVAESGDAYLKSFVTKNAVSDANALVSALKKRRAEIAMKSDAASKEEIVKIDAAIKKYNK